MRKSLIVLFFGLLLFSWMKSFASGTLILGIAGDYEHASADHDYLDINTLSPNLNTSKLLALNPDFQPDFSATIGYIFPLRNNDVVLHYKHFDSEGEGLFSGQPGTIGSGFTNSLGKIRFLLNRLDLIVGQYINVGRDAFIHPKMGLNLENIKGKYFSNQTGGTGYTDSTAFTVTSNFIGFGAIIGTDGYYSFGHGFGLVTDFDYTVSAGNIRADSEYDIIGVPETQNSFYQTNHFGRRVIPNFNCQFGISYDHYFNSNFLASLQLGYEIEKYFKPLDILPPGEPPHTTDLALDGPYASLTFFL